jgi:hypothetical protein
VSGQGQEDVVEACGVEGEPADPPSMRVKFVQQGTHLKKPNRVVEIRMNPGVVVLPIWANWPMS